MERTSCDYSFYADFASGKISVIEPVSNAVQASSPKGKDTLELNLLHKLSACIITLSIDDALKALDNLILQFVHINGRMLTAENAMYRLLIDVISLAFCDIHTSSDTAKAQIQLYIGQIRKTFEIGQLRQLLQESLISVSKQSDIRMYYLQIFEKIKNYIHKQYANPNLSAVTIAEYFDLAPSTITRLFKKYNQTGFLEYLHQVRVNKATELLQTTNLPISQVSTLVGYTSATTMSRAFKSHANSTPSMIRNRLQK